MLTPCHWREKGDFVTVVYRIIGFRVLHIDRA
jgi:hypothetical protein